MAPNTGGFSILILIDPAARVESRGPGSCLRAWTEGDRLAEHPTAGPHDNFLPSDELSLHSRESQGAAMAFNVADLFEHAVDAVPERTALICEDRRFTYRELDERANRLAHHLAARGIRVGDHVGVYSRNSVGALETMLATYKLRAVSVCVNYRHGAEEVRYIVANADLKALVHEAEYADIVAAVRAAAPSLTEILAIGPDYDAAVAAQSPERISARAAETISTSSIPAAPPACPGASCGDTRTCGARSAAASTM